MYGRADTQVRPYGVSYHPIRIIRRMANPIRGRCFPQSLVRMQPIHFPSHRIGGDVFPDAIQFRFVAHDVFPIIALP